MAHRFSVTIPPAHVPVLRSICDEQGIPISDFLRKAALSALGASTAAPSIPRGPSIYADAVEAAARATSGIPRVHLEAIVAATINSLHSHGQKTAA